MEIFKQLKELGYKHYIDLTIEELDKLPIDCIERRVECSLVIDWFREKYNWVIFIDVMSSTEYYSAIREFDENGATISKIKFKVYETYEIAREETILQALDLLSNKIK